jgi:uncharacterized membrane protein
MTEAIQASTDEPGRGGTPGHIDMEVFVGYILLGGVLLSAGLVGAGLIWHWAATGTLGLRSSIGRMNLYEFVATDIRQVTRGAVRPHLLVSLGVAALMLTPYARVLVSMLYFALAERNGKYAVFTAFVFAVLTYSLFLR